MFRFLWTPTSIKKHRREGFDIIISAFKRANALHALNLEK
jgi:hypothetical protein